MAARANQLGFTLMELLVVFLIISLIAVMLLQGTSFLYGNYMRVQSHLDELQSDLLPNSWLRSSVSSLVAGTGDVVEFEGGPQSFQGYTLSSVTLQPGSLVKIQWSLEADENGVALNVIQNDLPPIRINRWNAADARFTYFQDAETQHERWPARSEDAEFLPAGIALQIDFDSGETRQIVSATEMTRKVRPDFRGDL